MLEHVGYRREGPIAAGTDNKGAFDLCHRNSAGDSTRHVKRREFKMRELVARQQVKLSLVRTAEMHADFLTKVLDITGFNRCRAALMSLKAAGYE